MFSTFYHNLTRKYVATFGNMFNDITVVRLDANNKRIQSIPVEIRYSRKQRWMSQILADPQDQKYALSFPRIAFERVNFSYDTNRQTSPLSKIVGKSNDKARLYSSFQAVPYKMEFEMTIIAKNQDDICQIYEQIFPYFTPDHTNTVILVPEIDLRMDIPFRITGISDQDTYESNLSGAEPRYVTYTINFEADIWFVGPISNSGPIKRIILNFSDTNVSEVKERNIITPGLTEDGKPTHIKEESIPWIEIEEIDDYGFMEELYSYDTPKGELDYER